MIAEKTQKHRSSHQKTIENSRLRTIWPNRDLTSLSLPRPCTTTTRWKKTTIIERQLELMDRFVSNTTRLVLVPFHYVAIARMRYEFQKALNFHGENGERIRRDEWTRQINTILYRLASKRFINGRHLLLIPNLEQASRYITDHNADGLHMEQNWYQHILSAIVQHLCDM